MIELFYTQMDILKICKQNFEKETDRKSTNMQ